MRAGRKHSDESRQLLSGSVPGLRVGAANHSVLMLKDRLDALYTSFNCVDSATDPIQIVRRFTDPADREVVGFCAAALAFGRVASVLQSIERLVAVIGRVARGVRARLQCEGRLALLNPSRSSLDEG